MVYETNANRLRTFTEYVQEVQLLLW